MPAICDLVVLIFVASGDFNFDQPPRYDVGFAGSPEKCHSAKVAPVFDLAAARETVRADSRHLLLTARQQTLQPIPCRRNGKFNDRKCGRANQQSEDT